MSLAIAVVAAIAASYGLGRRDAHSQTGGRTGRRVLYYTDPMHPAYRSDKPGIAPDCGMPLEPVFAADAGNAAPSSPLAQLPAGAVGIDSAMQRLLGIQVAPVEKGGATRIVRVVGRVVPEDTRVYKINSGVDGFIRETYNDSVGTQVKKDQKLAAYYAPDFLPVASGFLAAVQSMPGAAGKDGSRTVAFPGAVSKQGVSSLQGYSDRLRNLGMSDMQIQHVAESHQLPENIDIVAPADGFILARNITPGQHFERNGEFYRIADLSRVWVAAEVYEQEAPYLRPGGLAKDEPVVRWTLRWKWLVIGAALASIVVTISVFYRLGSESMPPLDEGAILYMPTTLPGISISQAGQLLQASDRIIRQFPEVERVLGKAGRADTATDPAPLSMLETVIVLKPRAAWRRVDTWYSSWAPDWAKRVFRHVTPDTIATEQLIGQMNAALKLPGVSNSWTMPIKGRIDMLTTGIRTPVGLKIAGADLQRIQEIGAEIEALLKPVRGTRTALAERTADGYFLDLEWDREQLARYGVSVEDAQRVVENAIGGDNVSTVVLGRERYRVNVRYQRDFRSDLGALGRIPVPAGGQRQLPLSDLAKIAIATGPAMIRNENGLLTGYVYVDVAGRDAESYVNEANQLLRDHLKLGKQLPYCFDLNVNVHHNSVTLNSSIGDELFSSTPAGAGGITFCPGADGYKLTNNWICGKVGIYLTQVGPISCGRAIPESHSI